jgi:hypothetical protein
LTEFTRKHLTKVYSDVLDSLIMDKSVMKS